MKRDKVNKSSKNLGRDAGISGETLLRSLNKTVKSAKTIANHIRTEARTMRRSIAFLLRRIGYYGRQS